MGDDPGSDNDVGASLCSVVDSRIPALNVGAWVIVGESLYRHDPDTLARGFSVSGASDRRDDAGDVRAVIEVVSIVWRGRHIILVRNVPAVDVVDETVTVVVDSVAGSFTVIFPNECFDILV